MFQSKGSFNFLSKNSILFLLITFILAIAYLLYSSNNLETSTKDLLISSVEESAVAVENNINSYLRVIESMAKVRELQHEDLSFEEKFFPLEPIIRYNKFISCFISDTTGESVSYYGEPFNFKKYEFFNQALKGISSVSEPIPLNYGNLSVSYVAAPIMDENENIIGVISASFPAGELEELISGIKLVEDGVFFIINNKSEVIVGSNYKLVDDITVNDVRNDSPEYQSVNQLLKYAISEKKGEGQYRLNNKKMFSVFTSIKNTDWILISSASRDKIFKNVTSFILLSSSVMVIVVLLLLFLSIRSSKLYKNLKLETKKSDVAISAAKLMIIEIMPNGKIIQMNENFMEATGYSIGNNEEVNIFDIVSKSKRKEFSSKISPLMQGGTIDEIDTPIIKKDTTVIHVLWVSNPVETNSGKDDAIELLGINITNLKEYQNKIHKLAYYDTLTELPNGTYLLEYITTLINSDTKFALLYMDMDNFKFINDTYGHAIGDQFLVEVSKKILTIRNDENVTLFRLGGDELGIVLCNPEDYGEIGDYGNMVLNCTSYEYNISNCQIMTTASVGISLFPSDGTDFGAIYKAADIAMNKAKEMGRARITFFNQKMRTELLETISMENDLKDAVKNNEFQLYYQPQYDFRTGKLYGYEALIRWISPTRGFVSPGAFIPQVEKNQLIIPIGIGALQETVDFINEITAMGYEDICISVNVSIIQVLHESFVSDVVNIIEKSGIDLKCIKLEITESIMMESIEINLLKLRELSSKGIKFALDDFGTGYSSLSYLKRMPISVLKIDKSFVDSILQDEKEIVSSVIDLAHNMGLLVVAEGVEEKMQLDWLRDNGCDICQGYFTGKPLPKAVALEHLGKNIYAKA